jgi:sarcosine oxidase subunit beta
MNTADAVIVGGGVMGCSLAYQLARRGLQVSLFERAELGSQSTGKCAGGVRQQFSSEVNVRVQMLAVRLLREFEEETGTPADFRQIGYMFVLSEPRLVEDFKALLAMWQRVGLQDACWLSPEQARERAPVLAIDDVLGCTFCPSDGIASPAGVTQGYAAAARRHGAQVKEGVEVTSIDVTDARIRGVTTAEGPVSAPAVFICAGAWSAEAGRMAGVEVPVLPYRRHIFVTDSFPAIPRTNPMIVDFATSLYFHPEGDGVLLGMSDRTEPSTFSQEVDWSFLERVVEAVTHRAPTLEQAGIKTGWAGLYETTPDHQAILGPVQQVEGLWCACGFSGHGFMQAPAAGLLLAQLLTEGRSEIDISSLGYDRFARGGLTAERNVI